MGKNNNLGDFLTDIASAIKTKKGDSTPINAQDFADEILQLQTILIPDTGVAEKGRETIPLPQDTLYSDTGNAKVGHNVPFDMDGSLVYNDGEHLCYFHYFTPAILDTTNYTATPLSTAPMSLSGEYLGQDVDGTVYFDYGYNGESIHYVGNKNTLTGEKSSQNSIIIRGESVGNDGVNSYYGSDRVLNRTTHTGDSGVTGNYPSGTSFSPSGSTIGTDGDTVYYSNGTTHLVLSDRETHTGTTKTGSGLTNFYSSGIGKIGNNIFHSSGTNHYKLNKATSAGTLVSWPVANFSGSNIGSDGTNSFLSKDVIGSTLFYRIDNSLEGHNLPGFTTENSNSFGTSSRFNAKAIGTDGTNIFYSDKARQYVLNKSTSTGVSKTGNGISPSYGTCVGKIGNSVFYSNGTEQYQLNKDTSTGSPKVGQGLTNFSGNAVGNDDSNTYYSNGTSHYQLNKSTSTGNKKTGSGLTNFSGDLIGKDPSGNVYYSTASSSTTVYVLNKTNSTGSQKTFSPSGPSNKQKSYIGTTGAITYCSTWALMSNSSGGVTQTGSGDYSAAVAASYIGNDAGTDGDEIYFRDNAVLGRL